MIENLEFNLYLIRHGESEVNTRPDEMGQLPNSKLTELGDKQAILLSKSLKDVSFDYIFSSPYDRALNTAKYTAANNESKIILVNELREYDAGAWIGASRQATMTDSIKLSMGYLNNTFKPPEGESLNQVERRASQWLEDNILYNKSFRNKKLNIALFSHGMTIKCLLHYIMGFDRNFTWKISIDNTSITKLNFCKEGWKLLCVNDCSHLR